MTGWSYDLSHASRHLGEAEQLLDRWLGQPVVGVLDIGPGTGWARLPWRRGVAWSFMPSSRQ
jgi:hypothetical protein